MAYSIKSGDTLDKIAAKYGCTVSEIMVANPSIVNANEIFVGQSIELPEEPEPMGPYSSDENLDENNTSNGLVYCPNASFPFSPQIAPPIVVDNPGDLGEPCPGSDIKCTVLKVSIYDEERRVVGDKGVLEVVPATTSGEKITLRQLNFDCSEDIHWSISSALTKEELDGDGASFNVTPPLLRHASISPLSRWALKAVPKEYRVRSSKDCGVSGQSMTVKTYPSEVCKFVFKPDEIELYQKIDKAFKSFIDIFTSDNIVVDLLKGELAVEGQWKEHTNHQAYYAYDIGVGFAPLVGVTLKVTIVDALRALSLPPKVIKVVKKYLSDLLYIAIFGKLTLDFHLKRDGPDEYSKWEAKAAGQIGVELGAEYSPDAVSWIEAKINGTGSISLITSIEPKGTDLDDKPIKIELLFDGLVGEIGLKLGSGYWCGEYQEKFVLVESKPLISNYRLDLFS